jgi:hypothetical protein
MPMPHFGTALLSLALVASTLSCSVLIDTTAKQCSSDTDCSNAGDAFAGTTCQDHVCAKPEVSDVPSGPRGCPEVDPSASATVKLSFSVSFAVTAPAKPQPFAVQACKRLDTLCDQPVSDVVLFEPGKQTELEVPTGFQGFLQVTNPDALSSIVFLGQKAQQDTRFWDLRLLRESDVSDIGTATDTPIHRTLGTLVMIARDCQRAPLAGVVASNSTDGTGFYFAAMAADTTLTATTEEGVAGFLNVSPGTAGLSGTYDGRPMSATSVESRAQWLSYAEVFP